MKHRNLQSCHFPGSHTAINLAAMLEKLVNNRGINLSSQVLAFTTDNARNVVNAISECLGLTSIPCARYSINLTVQDALAVKRLRSALGRSRKIVAHFNRSRLDNEELET